MRPERRGRLPPLDGGAGKNPARQQARGRRFQRGAGPGAAGNSAPQRPRTGPDQTLFDPRRRPLEGLHFQSSHGSALTRPNFCISRR